MKKAPEKSQLQHELTDVWNADRFAATAKGKLMFVQQRGTWFEFDGVIWQEDSKRHVVQQAINLTRDMILEASKMMIDAAMGNGDVFKATQLAKHAKNSQSKKSIEAMISLAQSYPEMCKNQGELDAQDEVIAVQNGVLDLKAGLFREGTPDDLITRQSKAEYLGGNEDVLCPLFHQFLNTVQPDPDVRHWLQKLAGYCLTGRGDEQFVSVFHGGGSNGKSVYIDLMKRVLGSYAKNVQFDTFVDSDKKSDARNDLAALDKARLVVAQEGQDGARLDEGIVKQLAGQDEVTARFLHKEFFSFYPRFKVILVSNYKPVITGSDNGIWRKVVLVPWPVTIPSELRDRRLIDKLEAELPGILAWCVEGYHLWKEQGLSDLPLALVKANAEYRKDSDVLGLWLDDCCTLDESGWVAASSLYESYERWARAAGFRPISQKTLGDRLRDRGLVPSKSGSVRKWNGINLKA